MANLERVGKYEIDEEIGRGTMGVVYRATHEFTRRTVALKVLSTELATSEMGEERFRREVGVSTRVDDDGLVEVYDAGRFEETFYYAMELLEGQELAELMGEISLSEGLGYVADAAETLAACHDAGIVHRDLKPANIFIPSNGDGTKILDFGVASVRDTARATQTGFALGTPYYMSPEQAHDPRAASPESDIWSLGVILYEIATGSLPFGGESAVSVMMSVVEESPPPLDAQGEIDPELRTLIDQCLEKDPANRISDGRELADRLRSVDTGGAQSLRAEISATSIEETADPDGGEPPSLVDDESTESTAGDDGTLLQGELEELGRSSALLWVAAAVAGLSLIGLAVWVQLPEESGSSKSGPAEASDGNRGEGRARIRAHVQKRLRTAIDRARARSTAATVTAELHGAVREGVESASAARASASADEGAFEETTASSRSPVDDPSGTGTEAADSDENAQSEDGQEGSSGAAPDPRGGRAPSTGTGDGEDAGATESPFALGAERSADAGSESTAEQPPTGTEPGSASEEASSSSPSETSSSKPETSEPAASPSESASPDEPTEAPSKEDRGGNQSTDEEKDEEDESDKSPGFMWD